MSSESNVAKRAAHQLALTSLHDLLCSELRPPTPPPAGWEDVVVANRKFRLAIRVVLGSWIDRAVRSAFSRLYCAVTDKKYFREKEEEVRRGLYRWFRDILIPCTTEWRAIAAQTAVMR